MLEKLENFPYVKKIKIQILYTFHKNDQKSDHRSKCKISRRKYRQEKHVDHRFGDELQIKQKAKHRKEKTMLDFIKIKTSVKETVKAGVPNPLVMDWC